MEYFFEDKYNLGLWELKNDVLFGKIPKDSYSELIDFSWEIGSEKAKDCMRKYNTTSAIEIAEKLNLCIFEIDNGFVSPEYRVFSEYSSNAKKIVLFKNTITDEIDRLKEKGIVKLSDYWVARELFIAHEIFHHLECHEIGLTSKKKKITTLKLGPIEITSGIRALCEIGAHGFTKTLLNID